MNVLNFDIPKKKKKHSLSSEFSTFLCLLIIKSKEWMDGGDLPGKLGRGFPSTL